jgi:hypothetical protein
LGRKRSAEARVVLVAALRQRRPRPFEPLKLTLAVTEKDEPHPRTAHQRGPDHERSVGRAEQQRDDCAASACDRRRAENALHPPM